MKTHNDERQKTDEVIFSFYMGFFMHQYEVQFVCIVFGRKNDFRFDDSVNRRCFNLV